MLTQDKLAQAKFMHCLPVRRNVVVVDEVLDSEQSIVIQQAKNRTYAAQAVLKELLKEL
jgi:N-succinyl-L-ornithine transcarbamylase